jgi:hypothetical protein
VDIFFENSLINSQVVGDEESIITESAGKIQSPRGGKGNEYG